MICYDTRGHGLSSTPNGPYTVEQLGEDVVRLLDHLNINKAAFCGISMGGLTGQWLAIHYLTVLVISLWQILLLKLVKSRHGLTVQN